MFHFRFHVANQWTVETTLTEERDATNRQTTFSQTFRLQDSGTICPRMIWCQTWQGKQTFGLSFNDVTLLDGRVVKFFMTTFHIGRQIYSDYFLAQNPNVEESDRHPWTRPSIDRRLRRTPWTTWTRRRRWVTRTATRVSDAGKWPWDEREVFPWPICRFRNKRLRPTRPSRTCKTTTTTRWSVLTTTNRFKMDFPACQIDDCGTLKHRQEDPAVFRPRNPVMTRTRPGKVLRGVLWKTTQRSSRTVERFWETATIVTQGNDFQYLLICCCC